MLFSGRLFYSLPDLRSGRQLQGHTGDAEIKVFIGSVSIVIRNEFHRKTDKVKVSPGSG